jgi:hypothetical protein
MPISIYATNNWDSVENFISENASSN